MKKIAIVGLITIIFAGYILWQNTSASESPRKPSPEQVATPTIEGTAASGSATPSSGNAGPSYKDGTYTGQSADAFYGNVQVQAVISGGKLTSVTVLQYPNDNGHSMMVSNFSLPTLKQEAIQSQSATVDTVSGATQTSQAFSQSLASALSQAE